MLFGRKSADFDATDDKKTANKFQSIYFQEIILLNFWRTALKGTSSFSTMFFKSIFFHTEDIEQEYFFLQKTCYLEEK